MLVGGAIESWSEIESSAAHLFASAANVPRRRFMTWRQRFRVRQYLQTSMWVFPVVSLALAIIAVRLLHWLEEAMGWEAARNPEATRAVLGTLAGAMFTLIVFVCS